MKNKEKALSLILLISTWLTEAHSFALYFYPETLKIEYSFWLSSDFVLNMSVIWYFKMLSETLLKVVTLYVILKLRYGYSTKMWWILTLHFAYQFFDMLSFLWNYKEHYLIYWLLLGIITICQLFIIFTKQNNKLRAV